MRKVWTADNPGDAHVLKDLLESRGIAASVQGEQAFAGGDVLWGAKDSYPTVWIKDDSQFDEARKTAAEFDKSGAPPAEGEPWTCPKCGEKLDPQFTDCWKCSG